MKRYVFAAAALTAFLAAPAVARAADCAVKAPPDLVAPGQLTIGTTLVTPPQGFLDDNKPAGFAVELGAAIAGQMCLKPEVMNFPLAGLFAGLNGRKLDIVLSGIGITPERQQAFDFIPYFQGGVRLIIRKDLDRSFKTEDDLCGFTVATLTGSVEAHALERANEATCAQGKKIEVMGYPNWNEAIQQLRKQVVQIAFVDWPFANYLAQTVPEFAVGSPILSGTPGKPRNKHGIVVRKGDTATLEAIRAALENVEANGTYDAILGKWHVTEGDIRLVQ